MDLCPSHMSIVTLHGGELSGCISVECLAGTRVARGGGVAQGCALLPVQRPWPTAPRRDRAGRRTTPGTTSASCHATATSSKVRRAPPVLHSN